MECLECKLSNITDDIVSLIVLVQGEWNRDLHLESCVIRCHRNLNTSSILRPTMFDGVEYWPVKTSHIKDKSCGNNNGEMVVLTYEKR